MQHGLGCKKGRLVGIRHDDVRDEAGAVSTLATSAGKVSYEPPTFHGRYILASQQVTRSSRANNKTLGPDARGDVMVHGLWKTGQSCVLDVRVSDTDAKSYKSKSSAKVLEAAEKEKKDKYLHACLERRRSFMPLCYSVDGMAGKEAKAFEKRIASMLAAKWESPYSEMMGYIRGRMGMAVVRANTMMLRGSHSRRRFIPVVEDTAAFVAQEVGESDW